MAHPSDPSAQRYAQMLAFLWAAEEGSFSAAARRHDVAPSTISKLVSRLEKRLGVRLFDRRGATVALTQEGRAYLERASIAAEAMDEADRAARHLSEQVEGVLRIQTMPSFAKHQIAPWLPAFMARHPKLRFEFVLQANFVDRFDQGLDIAIHSGALPDSGLVAQQIATSRWIVCASPGYLAAHGSPGTAAELAAHSCLNFGPTSGWSDWVGDGAPKATPGDALSRVTSSQGDLLRDLALAGAGIVRLAAFHIGEDLRSGALCEIAGPWCSQEAEPIYFVHHARRHMPRRIQAFRAELLSRISSNDWLR